MVLLSETSKYACHLVGTYGALAGEDGGNQERKSCEVCRVGGGVPKMGVACTSAQVGRKGFAGKSHCKTYSLFSITGARKRTASEAVEKASG